MNRWSFFVCFLVLASSPAFAQGWQDRTAMPGIIWGSKIVIEEKPCCPSGPGAPARTLSDESVVSRLRGQAYQDGRVLMLRLDDGRTLKITDCDDLRECPVDQWRYHRLVAWWPDRRYYVINVGAHEAQMGYLIREADGLIVRLAAPPVLSPSGRSAISWDPSVLAGPTMDFLDMRQDPPDVKEITETIQCAGRPRGSAYPGEKPVWQSDTEVVFDDSHLLGDLRFRMSLRILPGPSFLWKCHL